MTHSLVLGHEIELLGDGSIINSGPAAGAVIRLGGLGNANVDFGAGEPQTTVITSLLLDGERPVGKRTGNATVELPIYVIAPGIAALIAARERVLQIVNQETWEMVVTLEGLPPTVFDCLRAKVSMPTVITHLQQDVCSFTVTAQRLPFGRSDTQRTIAVPAPPGTPGGGTISLLPDVVIDSFDVNPGHVDVLVSGSSWTSTHTTWNNSSTHWALQTGGASCYRRNLEGPTKDLTSYTGIRFYVTYGGSQPTSRLIYLTLIDINNRRWSLPWVNASIPGALRYVNCETSLASGPPTGFDISRLYRYEFQTNASIYVDDIVAHGSTVNTIGGSRGGVYTISNIEGSARTPINVDISRPAGGDITTGIIHHASNASDNAMPLIQMDPVAAPGFLTLPMNNLPDIFRGTYSVILSIAALAGAATQARATTITIAQFYIDQSHDNIQVQRTYTPNDIGTAKYLYLGRVTLPIRPGPPDLASEGWSISWSQTGLATGIHDSFTDLMFLDTEGQTIIWQNAPAHTHVFIDEPNPVIVNHGVAYTGASHGSSTSIMNYVTSMSGEPLGLNPGQNSMFVHCWDGATQLTVNYSPRWHGLAL